MSEIMTPTTSTTTTIEPIKVVAGILQSELGLPNGAVMLENQKWDLTQKGLYIVLQYIGPSRPIGGANYLGGDDGTTEIQEASFMHTVQIDLMSYDGSARARKEEVMLALDSIYSQQQQGANLIKISKNVAPFIPAPTLEATAQLNRFVTSVTVFALHRKTKTAQYYDTFQTPEVVLNV